MVNHPASFRDPSGHVFIEKNTLYRSIYPSYFSEFNHLEKSGLYKKLVDQRLIIPHRLVSRDKLQIIIQPDLIPFISYPGEWTFEALKKAALLTLQINILSLEYKMILKDATAYNVQLIGSKPIFIDTLSFDHYHEGRPWYAFGQFCRNYIAPLLLLKYKSLHFSKSNSSLWVC